ncbi:hypothetical protein F5880DRAFT_1616879 [Lentinula raphanica]|nr:hypothetical protein F5880DRAFT_1616879 [Lentinula raphanica]
MANLFNPSQEANLTIIGQENLTIADLVPPPSNQLQALEEQAQAAAAQAAQAAAAQAAVAQAAQEAVKAKSTTRIKPQPKAKTGKSAVNNNALNTNNLATEKSNDEDSITAAQGLAQAIGIDRAAFDKQNKMDVDEPNRSGTKQHQKTKVSKKRATPENEEDEDNNVEEVKRQKKGTKKTAKAMRKAIEERDEATEDKDEGEDQDQQEEEAEEQEQVKRQKKLTKDSAKANRKADKIAQQAEKKERAEMFNNQTQNLGSVKWEATTDTLIDRNKHLLGCALVSVLLPNLGGNGPEVIKLPTQRALHHDLIEEIATSPHLLIYDEPIDILVPANSIVASSLIPYSTNVKEMKEAAQMVQWQNIFDNSGKRQQAFIANGNHRIASVGPFLDNKNPSTRPWSWYQQAQNNVKESPSSELQTEISRIRKILSHKGIWFARFHNYNAIQTDTESGSAVLQAITNNNAMVHRIETEEDQFQKILAFLRQTSSDNDRDAVKVNAQTFISNSPSLAKLVTDHFHILSEYVAVTPYEALQKKAYPPSFFLQYGTSVWPFLHSLLKHSFLVLQFLFDPKFPFFSPDDLNNVEAVLASDSAASGTVQIHMAELASRESFPLSPNMRKFIEYFITDVAESSYLDLIADGSAQDHINPLKLTKSNQTHSISSHELWQPFWESYCRSVIAKLKRARTKMEDLGVGFSSNEVQLIDQIPIRLSIYGAVTAFRTATAAPMKRFPLPCPSLYAHIAEDFKKLVPAIQLVANIVSPGIHLMTMEKRKSSKDKGQGAVFSDPTTGIWYTFAYHYQHYTFPKDWRRADGLATSEASKAISAIALSLHQYRHIFSLYEEKIQSCFKAEAAVRLAKGSKQNEGSSSSVMANALHTFIKDAKAYAKQLAKTANQPNPQLQRWVPDEPKDWSLDMVNAAQCIDDDARPVLDLLKCLPYDWTDDHRNATRVTELLLSSLQKDIIFKNDVLRPLLSYRSLLDFYNILRHRLAVAGFESFYYWLGTIPDNEVKDDIGLDDEDNEASLELQESMKKKLLSETISMLNGVKTKLLQTVNGGITLQIDSGKKKPTLKNVLAPNVADAFQQLCEATLEQANFASSSLLGLVPDDGDVEMESALSSLLGEGLQATRDEYSRYEKHAADVTMDDDFTMIDLDNKAKMKAVFSSMTVPVDTQKEKTKGKNKTGSKGKGKGKAD